MLSFPPRYRVAILHISFWCVYLSFFLYRISGFYQEEPVDWRRIWIIAVLSMVFLLLIAYTNYFYLLPRYLQHKKLGRYLLELGSVFGLLITFRIYLERYLIDGFTYQEEYLYSLRFIIHVSLTTLFIVIFIGMLRFAEEWFELEAKKKEMENEKLTAELRFLKAQVNPHFLFNTLNNLYYLAFTQSPNTTEVIEKLSQMMRYMLYDSNHPQVSLCKEIEYMENYISLEKLRLNNPIPIRFTVEGAERTARIAPLIFITFLENAFKHGVSNTHAESWVNISIKLCGQECVYEIENSKLPVNGKVVEEKSGIGLQNVQRRLDLTYPQKYELAVDDTPDRYAVRLKLQLT
ncbi:Histidine kinase [Catalinimonas alkaloidigena]|uniref:Histidine kinase n=2 Tax=Catalinimonas alkaloidigena TaxID=1075417 RepID=A0A1G9BTD1_9BACT|nr:Histidine kinase [Catalinimonas alkaloidigena]